MGEAEAAERRHRSGSERGAATEGRTERRRAEQRAELERQRDQFAIEAAGIGVWERRAPDGMPIYWSPTMYRLRGLDGGAKHEGGKNRKKTHEGTP